MKKVILFRNELALEDEILSAKKYFDVYESRMEIPKNSLVIGRYSVLPFYKELERDLLMYQSQLINNFKEHSYIAQMDYLEDIKDYTPKTYYNLSDIKNKSGSFILKGRTNSRKQQWKEKMFADSFEKAVEIYRELSLDPLIGEQGVVIREYVPLKNYGIGVNGMPFADEWRLFFYNNNLLAYNFYWSISDVIPSKDSLPKDALAFAKLMASKVCHNTNFFVMDIARTQKGEWIVIELNDAQMSGLSLNDPEELYFNLKKVLK